MKTALTRANAARDIALAGSWRGAVAHLSHAVEVCREVEAADSNGDAKLAKAVRAAIEVEAAKIAERMGDLPHARPPQESAGEYVDSERVEAVREARKIGHEATEQA
jgi:hypothetical protein